MPAKVDNKRCIGCKRCYTLCPLDICSWNDANNKPIVAYEDECWHCGICWMECPKRAIDIKLPASLW